MNATPSSGIPTDKRAKLAGFASWFFQLLRSFWVTWLVLLFVVLYGLYAGWTERKQWSDAFFYAAIAQIFVAAIAVMGSSGEYDAASEVRYIAKSDVSETRDEINQHSMRRLGFSLRAFFGGLFTMLIAGLATWA